MNADLHREAFRKAFHLLSLVYLAAFHWLGREMTLRLLGGWILLEGTLEVVRLRAPALNDALISFFGGIHREEEAASVSGILWTSIGCWLTFFFFGSRSVVVVAALCYLAIGDMMAAMVGKAIGRTQIGLGGRKKTLEGSLGCLFACGLIGWAVGLRPAASFAGAAVATAIELLPMPLNDNLWLPLGAALVLSFF